MKYDVIGIGNALLDYQVEVPFEFIEKHSLTRGSMTLVDEKTQHKLISEIRALKGKDAIRTTSGGCAANTLAGFQSFGGKGYFIGKIAEDDHGEFYKQDLKSCGIGFDLHPGTSAQTGTCLALITPDAERTMLTHLGIAVELGPRDISFETIQKSDMVYIEGYLWDSQSARAASREAMKMAKEQKKKIAFTFSDSFCVGRYHDDFVSLAKEHINVLFCNEDEAKMATKTATAEDAFQVMKGWCETVSITAGARGAFVSRHHGKETEEVPTWPVNLVDTLGAGDLFAAGFLYGLSTNHSLRECGYLGCYAASKIIQQMSARLNGPLSSEYQTAVQGPLASQLSSRLIAL